MKIKVGAVNYKVLYVKNLSTLDASGQMHSWMGTQNLEKCKISIRKGMGESITIVTILHELMHGILDNAGIRDHNEQYIDVISHGVALLAEQNPDFMKINLKN